MVSIAVLGSKGVTRDVIAHTLHTAGRDTVDLVALESNPEHVVVAVLVRPTDSDWERARSLQAEIVVIVDTDHEQHITDAVLRGADAVITTRSEPQHLLEAIDVVAEGGSLLTPRIARLILDELRAASTRRQSATLTPRETDILLSIERGESIKQTARALGISDKTVQNIQSRLFGKLEARNRAQAITRAHELGLLRSQWGG